MTQTGQLNERLSLQRQALDGNGDYNGPWQEQAQVAVRLQSKLGGEGVFEQRIQGSQPVVLSVRASSITRLIDNAWRAVNTRTRQIYDISGATITEDRAWVQILAVAKSGRIVAAGRPLTDG